MLSGIFKKGTDKDALVWNNRGRSLNDAGRFEDAIKCFDKALKINGKYADAWQNKGDSLRYLKRFEQAIKSYDKALEINPANGVALIRKGICYEGLKNYAKALECCDEALKISVRNDAAWNNKGIYLGYLGRREEQLRSFDKALEIVPNSTTYWTNKADALRELGRFEEAIQCYNRAIKINPKTARQWLDKGDSLLELNRFEEALQCYNEAIRIDPKSAESLDGKGWVLYKLGRFEESIQCYDKAIEMNPNYATSYNRKGIILWKLKRYKEAIQQYDKAIGINPQSSDPWNNKGLALDNLGRFEEAIKVYEKAIELDPQSAITWRNKGLSLEKLGLFEEAVQCYEKAIEINPKYTDAWENKADIEGKIGRSSESKRSQQQLIDIRTRIEKQEVSKSVQTSESDTPYLDHYSRDLTKDAREGKLGPFVGREKELLQVIQTLARRNKNNPVLVGEAGVGKTAVVEALAVRVVQEKDPQILGGRKILELNVGALVGGTKFRGEFEERLSRIIEEVRTHPQILLFVDELHNVVGAGRADGSMDAANLLKPALARGDLRCIGATTIAEYRRYVESDPALERRFEKIIVNEPSPEETLEMLKGIRPKLQEHHNAKITDEALEAAINLSIRFDIDHQLPDKAIDLVDKAGARTRVLSQMKKSEKTAAEKNALEVTEMTIAEVLSEKVNVPLEIITGHLEGMSKSRLIVLESFIKNRLVGQDAAVERVCKRLILAHSGLTKRCGPIAVFLFLGPTGVGKTELAKLLSKFLFGSESEMIRLDMSEYMEEHSVAKMIGSPPGYVGHEEEGQLTGRLRTKPYSVVLLDEIEKAHPRVLDMFLQVFDEGRLTDSKGRTIDARNVIFIMTSNIQANEPRSPIYGGTEGSRASAFLEATKWFRPELLNRIDEQIVFRNLDVEDIKQILKPLLSEICENLQIKYDVTLYIEDEAERLLVQAGYNPQYGARELKRIVDRLVQIPLSNIILDGRLKESSCWKAIRSGNELSFFPVKCK